MSDPVPARTSRANITIHVPQALRVRCGGAAKLQVAAGSVRAALEEIELRHSDLYAGICDDSGTVRKHVNLFVNDVHVRDREGLDTGLASGDVITILPAVSGG